MAENTKIEWAHHTFNPWIGCTKVGPGYVIDRTAAGKPLTKTAQVRMAGNSVSPLPMRLIVSANCGEQQIERRAA